MTVTTFIPQQVTQRAKAVAWALARGAITPEALAVHADLSVTAAAECLDEAVDLELLERHSILVGYPDLYITTRTGRIFARKYSKSGGYTYPRDLRKPRVTIREARHTIGCLSAVAALERRYPECCVVSERELQRDEREQKRRPLGVEFRFQGVKRTKRPDIVIWPPSVPPEPSPLPILVEIELRLKSKEYLRAICRGLANSTHRAEATLYYTELAEVEDRLLTVVDELKVEDSVVVLPLSDLIDSLPGFDLSPRPIR